MVRNLLIVFAFSFACSSLSFALGERELALTGMKMSGGAALELLIVTFAWRVGLDGYRRWRSRRGV